jgi:signal transduction histidine kinase
MPSKKNTVVLLRWLLIVASSYLMILDRSEAWVPLPIAMLVVFALASNLLVGRLPEAWVESSTFDLVIAIFDAGWITLGLGWAPSISGELFLLYFLVIFIAAVGESLRAIVGSAVAVSVVYAATLGLQLAWVTPTSGNPFLRLPFLFVVALFYGYFVTEIRGRRSEARNARAREQAKTELLAAVSHDLRGPVGNADSMLEFALEDMREGRVPEEDVLVSARVNMRRVTALVSNLLEAACLEAGGMAFDVRRVQVNDIVRDVCTIEGGAAHLKGVKVRAHLEPDLPRQLTDAVQMDRIVTNLVNNAIKYTKPGGVVTVATTIGTERFSVHVQDQGPGLSESQCGELFAPYHRLHLEGYTQGKGLGLYIVKALAEGLGGEVSIVSEPGVGSTFTASFPLLVPLADATAKAERPARMDIPVDTVPHAETAMLRAS